MANLRRWSSTATGNASVAGGVNTINWAEGQAPSTVNNSAREMMAQMRGIYVPAEWGWVEHSNTASVASQTTFKLAGDQTANWTAKRRWRLKSGSTTRYGTVLSSSYTTETTVTVNVDSGSLSASHSLAALASIDTNHLPGMTTARLLGRTTASTGAIEELTAGRGLSLAAGSLTTVAGSVLQLVNAFSTSVTTTTAASGTYSDVTGWTATITPSATSSKIMVIISGLITNDRSTAGSSYCDVRLVRGASTYLQYFSNGGGNAAASGAYFYNFLTAAYLDSPSTTSATTYKMQIANGTTNNTATAGGGNTGLSMHLLEIAG